MDDDPPGFVCPNCGDILELTKKSGPRPGLLAPRGGRLGVWRYLAALPLGGSEQVSLDEGGTPLVRSARLGKELGIGGLHFKIEGQNPTGSFKDRGMTVAVTRAMESGATSLVCASTGNTAASLSAYASRGGINSAVVLPSGKVASGKLAQAIAHGARLVQVEDGFDRALKLTMKAVALSDGLYLMNSVNPYRIEGQKTVAYEIYEQLGRVPDYVVLPVGNAGNISAVWKGFRELMEWGLTEKTPKLIGVQAAGASPLAEAYSDGGAVKPWTHAETVASAIRIGNPVSWKKALSAVKGSNGMILAVPDREILRARRDLAAREGTFVENASASPLAGLRKLGGYIDPGSTVVCILTGHGLKDKVPPSWRQGESKVVRDAGGLVRALS